MSDAMFDTMLSELDSFSYDQCVTLLSRLSQVFKTKKQESMATNHSPIDEFFGTIDDEESEKMLQAVQDCRKIEPNEW